LFGFAAGGEAGSGEDFLEAEHVEFLDDGFKLTVKKGSGECCLASGRENGK
jgi:hypothetical protein